MDIEEKVSARRNFMKITLAATAGAVVAPSSAWAGKDLKKVRIASLPQIKPWHPVEFDYPENQPSMLLDVGQPVQGGVGSKKSIIAFSTLCQHMGCPLSFDSQSHLILCGCHDSVYDPSRAGMAIEGPATRGLPRVALSIEGDDVYATGIEDGLIYGHASNA